MIIMIRFLVLVLALPLSVFATEGYLPSKIEINYIKGRGAVIQSTACFPVTVTVNNKDFSVPANTEVPIGSEMWGHWYWRVGVIGSMTEKTVTAPLKKKLNQNMAQVNLPLTRMASFTDTILTLLRARLCMLWITAKLL
jgi:hypothetical protein